MSIGYNISKLLGLGESIDPALSVKLNLGLTWEGVPAHKSSGYSSYSEGIQFDIEVPGFDPYHKGNLPSNHPWLTPLPTINTMLIPYPNYQNIIPRNNN